MDDETVPARLLAALAAAERAARRPPALRRRLRAVYDLATGPHEVTCRIFTGRSMRVVLPEIVGTQLYGCGYIEPQVSRVLVERLRPGMVFFDVGAQYGFHALVAAELVGPGGTVVAFEPSRASFRLLSTNVAATNGVIVENLAVGSTTGNVVFHDFGLRNSALNTVHPTARVPLRERRRLRADAYSVASTTLDEYVERTGLVPDVVKIDVEGAELAVLKGMTEVLRRGAPLLSIETGDYPEMDSPETAASIDYLERLGYECFEHRGELRPHRRQRSYGYDNLFFVKHAGS
jgi:FkbM family methyltransferase